MGVHLSPGEQLEAGARALATAPPCLRTLLQLLATPELCDSPEPLSGLGPTRPQD